MPVETTGIPWAIASEMTQGVTSFFERSTRASARSRKRSGSEVTGWTSMRGSSPAAASTASAYSAS